MGPKVGPRSLLFDERDRRWDREAYFLMGGTGGWTAKPVFLMGGTGGGTAKPIFCWAGPAVGPRSRFFLMGGTGGVTAKPFFCWVGRPAPRMGPAVGPRSLFFDGWDAPPRVWDRRWGREAYVLIGGAPRLGYGTEGGTAKPTF